MTVLQQHWGAALGHHAQGLRGAWAGDAQGLRGAWAGDLRHRTVSCGHFMAEEDPKLIADEIRTLADR
ncbi:hypothetical protein [Streptomyces coriariae]|uniref:hypothetical protein n=1 Tax=Streptomyces coriariae TaxID=2864460 RepID=UPI003556B3F2